MIFSNSAWFGVAASVTVTPSQVYTLTSSCRLITRGHAIKIDASCDKFNLRGVSG